MGILDLLRGSDINQGIETWKQTPGAMLLDVRSDEEYRQGHIPGSINMPLIEMRNFSSKVPDTNTPIFAYCLSGARSGRAVRFLKKTGYTNVQNIGAITGYHGRLATGSK